MDGQIATVDFAAFDNGEPIEGVKAESFDLALGERQALEDFEAPGQDREVRRRGEGEIRFPDDFSCQGSRARP